MAQSDKSGPKRKKKKLQRRSAVLFSWRRKFLDNLKVFGVLGYAARKTGISERTVTRHRRKDPKFAAACERAAEEAVDNVEASSFVDAVKGNTTLKIFILKKRRSKIYGDQPAQIIDLEKLVELLAAVPATIRRTEPVAPKSRVKVTGGNGRNGGRTKVKQ